MQPPELLDENLWDLQAAPRSINSERGTRQDGVVARSGFEDAGYSSGSAVATGSREDTGYGLPESPRRVFANVDLRTPIRQAVVSGFRISDGDVQVEKKVVATTKQLEYHVEGMRRDFAHGVRSAVD